MADFDVSDTPTEDPGFLVRGVITEDELCQRYVQHVLIVFGGNKTRAAKALGIDRRSLYRRLKPTGKREGT